MLCDECCTCTLHLRIHILNQFVYLTQSVPRLIELVGLIVYLDDHLQSFDLTL